MREYGRWFERHYSLGMHGGWTQGATWTRWMLCILGACWLLTMFSLRFYPPLGQFFVNCYLVPAAVVQGKLWQLITAPFFPVLCWWSMVFHLLYLLVFGPKVEREWGTPRFMRFFLIIAFVSTVVGFLVRMPFPELAAIPASTASAAIYAVMVAYASMWPRDPFWVFGLFPAPVVYIVMFLCAAEIIFMLLVSATEMSVDFVGAGCGIILALAVMRIPAVKTIILGEKRKVEVTTAARARRSELSQGTTLPGSSSRKPSSSQPKPARKGKRSKYLEL